MTDLDRLLGAIQEDSLRLARELMTKHPSLASALVPEARLYESKIIHWLYANDTALHLAAAGHRFGIVKLLLAGGADPNAAANHRHGRPLHYAADAVVSSPDYDEPAQAQTLALLLGAGAQIEAADKNGATALHRAVRTRSFGAVDFLLKAGADFRAPNHSGATPFHLAVQNTGRGGTGNPASIAAQRRIIELFLARGANPLIQDARGKSVRDWATSAWVRDLLGGKG